MRILLCLLVLVSAPAWAEWVKMGETDEGTVYIDPATIRKDGSGRRVWQVSDLKQRGDDGEMSVRGLNEYDCKEKRFKLISFSGHSDPMAGGKVLYSQDGSGKWTNIPPNTSATLVLKKVCAK